MYFKGYENDNGWYVLKKASSSNESDEIYESMDSILKKIRCAVITDEISELNSRAFSGFQGVEMVFFTERTTPITLDTEFLRNSQIKVIVCPSELQKGPFTNENRWSGYEFKSDVPYYWSSIERCIENSYVSKDIVVLTPDEYWRYVNMDSVTRPTLTEYAQQLKEERFSDGVYTVPCSERDLLSPNAIKAECLILDPRITEIIMDEKSYLYRSYDEFKNFEDAIYDFFDSKKIIVTDSDITLHLYDIRYSQYAQVSLYEVAKEFPNITIMSHQEYNTLTNEVKNAKADEAKDANKECKQEVQDLEQG